MPLGADVNVGPGDVVLDGVAAPPEIGTDPQFSVHVYCGQTAVCIRIPLGTQVGLSVDDIVLEGDLATLP